MQPSVFSSTLGTQSRPALVESPSTVITPAMIAPPPAPHLILGLLLLIAELFNIVTRFFEFYLTGFHIPMIISALLGVALVFVISPQSWNLFQWTTKLMLMGFIWISISTVFSTWRSNSVTQLTGYVFLATVGVAIIAMVDTPAWFVRILTITGLFYGFTALMAFFLARPDAPRLELWRGTYSDPNIYGLTVLTGLPIMWWLMKSGNIFMRVTALMLSLVMLWVILKTGSRGAFISVGLILLLVVFYASPMKKILIVTGLIIGVFAASMLLSTYAKKRLFTMFDSSVSEEDMSNLSGAERNSLQGDVGSSESRWQLLVDSLEITARNPIFGVGPGNFGEMRWQMHLLRVGRNIAAQTTHNTYTQFSSESGVLILVIFLAQIFDAFRNLRVVRKWNSRDGYMPSAKLLSAAHYLRLVLVALAGGAFFLSLAFNGPFCIIFGLSLALRNTVEKEWHRYRMAVALSSYGAGSRGAGSRGAGLAIRLRLSWLAK